jgi:transcriptional regulator with XRE-family HTH domain
MTSLQISITPSRRQATRFVSKVRRSLQKALAEEQKKRGLSQSDIARTIGVHRSVINRELHGFKDITMGRVGELVFAMGRKPVFDLLEATPRPARILRQRRPLPQSCRCLRHPIRQKSLNPSVQRLRKWMTSPR